MKPWSIFVKRLRPRSSSNSEHLAARAAQHERGAETGRSGADDDHVGISCHRYRNENGTEERGTRNEERILSQRDSD